MKYIKEKFTCEIVALVKSLLGVGSRALTVVSMKTFLQFTLIWISQNLAIPFWIVGHIHLSLNIYDDIKEILASMGMNLIVGVGFYLDYKKSLTTVPS